MLLAAAARLLGWLARSGSSAAEAKRGDPKAAP
jgi:hypothetical protein